MKMYDLIGKKKNGQELTETELKFIIDGYVNDEIPDYQVSALLMAIYFKGMTEKETALLTKLMAESGDMLDLSSFGNLSVDKHSTGGVGDKTSLIVAPIVASLGCKVAKMSGRGLGHTGGTVDKLESIPNYKTTLNADEFLSQVENVGVAIIGQSGNMAPADKKLYALRDVTATVDSVPLIASSIMSKKIAAGSHSIVLDVKYGSGAFMKTVKEAENLAKCMVKIGKQCGRKVAAVISNMDIPLGNFVGNSLEVIEAVGVLKGEVFGDLREVCIVLAAEMVSLAKGIDFDIAKEQVLDSLDSGKAYKKMLEWITSQGGNVEYIKNTDLFEKAKYQHKIVANCDGYVAKMDCEQIGNVAVTLGAGRIRKDSEIDLSAGIYIAKKSGDFVKKGDTLAVIYTNNEVAISSAESQYLNAVTIQNSNPQKSLLIEAIIR